MQSKIFYFTPFYFQIFLPDKKKTFYLTLGGRLGRSKGAVGNTPEEVTSEWEGRSSREVRGGRAAPTEATTRPTTSAWVSVMEQRRGWDSSRSGPRGEG